MIISLIWLLIYVAYIAINLVNQRLNNELIEYICGGLLMRWYFIIINVGYLMIGLVQYRAGCERLLADCYKGSLSTLYWMGMKDLFNLSVSIWLLVFFYRLFVAGFRYVCRN